MDKNQQYGNFNWKDHPVNDDLSKTNIDFAKVNYKIHDLWVKKDIGTTKKPFEQVVAGHDVVMIRLINN